MVRKAAQKEKPASAPAKTSSTRAKAKKPLSNGHVDVESDKVKAKTDKKIAITKHIKKGQKKENIPEISDNLITEEANEIVEESKPSASGSTKGPRKALKRKPPASAKEVKEVETKTKRQKFVLEVPAIHSVSGKVFVIGTNDVGQLGLGEDIIERRRPALLELPQSVVDVAAGGMHSVCLTESGEVFTFGCNDEGALGRNTTVEGSEYVPNKVEIPERIVQVSAGDSHSAALSDSGQVYIWGNFRCGDGPMGLVTIGAQQTLPVKILNNVTVVKIASGSDHLICLSNEGVVYSCGCAESGQLGRVSEFAVKGGGRKGLATLLTADKVSVVRSNKQGLVNNIWTNSYATFINMQDSGVIYAFGLNNYSQLGIEAEYDNYDMPKPIFKPKKVTSFSNKTWNQITGGQHHTLALDDSGLVYALGRPEYGRLGLGDNNAIKSEPTQIPSLGNEKCINISCGNVVSFAVTDNGSVFSWGMGTNNQLGHGNDEDKDTPHQIEGNFSKSWKAFKISGGGQHTLILATAKESLDK